MNHICVCICTYQRPQFLSRLLTKLADQETESRFTYSIVVADNDALRSGEPVTLEFATRYSIPILYCVEPQQNISLARNKAIENSKGDFIALIDDDEFPISSWLLNLYKTWEEYGPDGVLGPVRRHFDQQPPKWIVAGNFYEREILPTGSVVHWAEGRTGNVLLNSRILEHEAQPFKPWFRGGEDTDFFRRMNDEGRVFVWSSEAIAYESVPPARWKRRFMLKRALLRGAVTLMHPTFGFRDIAKSLIAVPLYAVALPFTLLLGHHKFMALLIRLFDHLGKLLATVGIRPIRGPYVTD